MLHFKLIFHFFGFSENLQKSFVGQRREQTHQKNTVPSWFPSSRRCSSSSGNSASYPTQLFPISCRPITLLIVISELHKSCWSSLFVGSQSVKCSVGIYQTTPHAKVRTCLGFVSFSLQRLGRREHANFYESWVGQARKEEHLKAPDRPFRNLAASTSARGRSWTT